MLQVVENRNDSVKGVSFRIMDFGNYGVFKFRVQDCLDCGLKVSKP